MRELTRVGPVMKGEARVIIRQGKVEGSQGVGISVSSWRERGGQRWLCIVLDAWTDPFGEAHMPVEVYVPVDVFEQRNGPELNGPSRAYVTR